METYATEWKLYFLLARRPRTHQMVITIALVADDFVRQPKKTITNTIKDFDKVHELTG